MKKEDYKFEIKCPMCGNKKYQSYQNHFIILEDIGKGKNFKCHICGYIFTELSYIQQSKSIKKKTNNHYLEESIQTPTDALQMIRGIALDYDGYRGVEDLKDIIDELRMIAETGLWRNKNKGDDK